MLDADEKQLLFDFIEACHIKVRRIEEDVIPKLRRLLAHQRFAYGTVDLGADRKFRCLGGNFPATLISNETANRRKPFYCLIKEWLGVRSPVYSEATETNSFDEHCRGPDPLGKTLAIHGVADTAYRSATWYAFSKDVFSSQDNHVIRIAVPHLHSALAAATASRTKVSPCLEPLTPREMEVLQWLSKGKANAEISMVLSISVCTVRVHIQNIFNKLPANNRTHAAARAMQLGLIDAVRPAHEPLHWMHSPAD